MPSRTQKQRRAQQALADRKKARMLQAQAARLAEVEEKRQWDLQWVDALQRVRHQRHAERERISKVRASALASNDILLTERQKQAILRNQLRMQKEEEERMAQWRLNKMARTKFIYQKQLLYDVQQRMDTSAGQQYMTWADDQYEQANQQMEDLSWEEYDSEHARDHWEQYYEEIAENRQELREAKERAIQTSNAVRRPFAGLGAAIVEERAFRANLEAESKALNEA
jgi:hypothetical protein